MPQEGDPYECPSMAARLPGALQETDDFRMTTSDLFARIAETLCAAKRRFIIEGRQMFAADIADELRKSFPLLNEGQPKPAKKQTSGMSEPEWLESLHSEPALAGLDIARELAKAQFWCKENGRKCTRRFLINWFNKADRTVAAQGGQTIQPTTTYDGPPNWRTTLIHLYPDNTYTGPWGALPESVREQVRSA